MSSQIKVGTPVTIHNVYDTMVAGYFGSELNSTYIVMGVQEGSALIRPAIKGDYHNPKGVMEMKAMKVVAHIRKKGKQANE